MKRMVEITSEEFDNFVKPKRKRIQRELDTQRIQKRNEFSVGRFARDHPGEKSLYAELVEHMVDADYDAVIGRDHVDFFGSGMLSQGIPKFDSACTEAVEDLGFSYTKSLLTAVPCNDELKIKIREIESRIETLTEERRSIIRTIRNDLGSLVQREIEKLMEKRISEFDQFLEEIKIMNASQ